MREVIRIWQGGGAQISDYWFRAKGIEVYSPQQFIQIDSSSIVFTTAELIVNRLRLTHNKSFPMVRRLKRISKKHQIK